MPEDDGLAVANNMLQGASGRQTARLHEFIAAASEAEIADEIISFPRVSGGRPYLVLVPSQLLAGQAHPRERGAARHRHRAAHQGLGRYPGRVSTISTPSETRVALMLIEGKRLDQIAEELEVAQTTVVFHLKNLFRKTDTNRQADLVGVLLSVPLRTNVE